MKRYRKLSTSLEPLVEGVNPGKEPIPEATWIDVSPEEYNELFKGPRFKEIEES